MGRVFGVANLISRVLFLKRLPVSGALWLACSLSCFGKSPKVYELYGPEFLLSIKEAQTLHEKAEELYNEAHYDEAFQSLKDALHITESALGPQHRDVANVLAIIAEGYFLAGDNDQALTLLNRSLTIGESALGTNHPVVARPLRDLSVV